jgi:hypothetical protein
MIPMNVTRIGLPRSQCRRGYTWRFIELNAPALTEAAVRAALAPGKDASAACSATGQDLSFRGREAEPGIQCPCSSAAGFPRSRE